MNIKFTDKKFFDELMNSTLLTVEIGSSKYGLNDENSDTDLMHIYAPAINELNSVHTNHHQLQYKDIENNIDHLFVSIHSFVKNAISGDSTINFEIINDPSIKDSILGFLFEKRKYFFTYNISRAYLGFAKRDIKMFHTSCSTEREKFKKIGHIYRGETFAKSIIDGEFDLKLHSEKIEFLHKIRNIFDNYKVAQEILENASFSIQKAREELNNKLNKKEIVKYMSPEFQKEIDFELTKLFNSEYYKSKQIVYRDLSFFYNSNENEIIYE